MTWRNFNVIDYVAAELCVHKCMIAGAPDTSRVFDLEILQRLPEKAEVVLETPLSLFASLPRDSFRKVVLDRKNQVARLTLPHLRSVPLPNVMLKRERGISLQAGHNRAQEKCKWTFSRHSSNLRRTRGRSRYMAFSKTRVNVRYVSLTAESVGIDPALARH